MDERELEILTTHLPHELTMLQFSLEQVNDLCSDSTANESNPRLIMAFECFWLHARNLIEFFRTNDLDAGTVSSRAFTNTAHDYGFDPLLMTRINEQITHLQRSRGLSANGPLYGSDMICVKERIDNAVFRFQADLKSDQEDWWTQRTPVVLEYSQSLSTLACTEIQMTTTVSSSPTSNNLNYDTGRNVTINTRNT